MASHAERSTSFGAIADDYDRLRPGPPPEAVHWLLAGAHREVVVDLAAGTGLLSRALVGKADRVVAVEPDGRMRAVLAARSPGVEALEGRGEAIPLPDASADALLISSAWHWMDPDLAAAEIARVLRDGGRFGVTGTGRDRSAPWLRSDEWFLGEESDANAARAAAALASREWRGRRVALPDSAPFANIETATFRFSRLMALTDLVDWMTTYSRVIVAGEDAKAAGRARATAALEEQFPGATEIEVPMICRCWRADRLPR